MSYRGNIGDNDYITCSKCRYKSLIKKAKLSDKSTDLLIKKDDKIEEIFTDLPSESKYKKEIVKPKVESIDEEHYEVDEHGKKYKPYTKNLGTATPLEPQIKMIRTIPYDPLAALHTRGT